MLRGGPSVSEEDGGRSTSTRLRYSPLAAARGSRRRAITQEMRPYTYNMTASGKKNDPIAENIT
jgi:hypothetical protein